MDDDSVVPYTDMSLHSMNNDKTTPLLGSETDFKSPSSPTEDAQRYSDTLLALDGHGLIHNTDEVLRLRERQRMKSIVGGAHEYLKRRPSMFAGVDIHKAQDLVSECAGLYVEDAVHGRRPNLRLQYGKDTQVTSEWQYMFITDSIILSYLSQYSPLEVYRFVHKNWWRYIMIFAVVTHMSLACFEPPTARWPSVGDGAWTIVLETICLGMYIVDSTMRAYSNDEETMSNMWVLLKTVLVKLTWLELVVAIGFRIDGTHIFRFMRVTRPYFLIEKGRNMKQIVIGILDTIPAVVEVCLLLLMLLGLFSFGGFILFSEKGNSFASNSNFLTLEDSFLSLFVLLTTANYPDVMMQSYAKANWTAIFFIIYLAIGLYFLLSLVLAAVYGNFSEHTQRMAENMIKGEAMSLAASFDLLAANPGERIEDRFIDYDTFEKFMISSRPELVRRHIIIIFCTLDSGGHGKLTLREWSRLTDFFDAKIKGDHKRRADANEFMIEERKRVQALLTKNFVEPVFDLVVVFNAFQIVYQLEIQAADSATLFGFSYANWNLVFLCLFLLEAIIKIFALGFPKYMRGGFNRLDFLIITAGFSAILIPGLSALGSITFFRLLRLLRIIRAFKRFNIYFKTILEIIPTLITLTGILFCVYYVFAICGMELFGGVITAEKFYEPNSALKKKLEDVPGWIGGGGDTTELHQNPAVLPSYLENNFNDIIHSMVTLWELMIVNNWFITMNGYAAATSRWSRPYFMFFYFVTVLVVMNCVVAFIIDAFQKQFELAKHLRNLHKKEYPWAEDLRNTAAKLHTEQNANEQDPTRLVPNGLAMPPAELGRFRLMLQDMHPYKNLQNWRISRKRRTPHLYKVMYADINSDIHLALEEEVDIKRQIIAERDRVINKRLAQAQTGYSLNSTAPSASPGGGYADVGAVL